jgi:hypothetical protein
MNEIELQSMQKNGRHVKLDTDTSTVVGDSTMENPRFYECRYIGNIRGYFPSSETGRPRVFIGPTWPFAIPILLIVFFLIFFLT